MSIVPLAIGVIANKEADVSVDLGLGPLEMGPEPPYHPKEATVREMRVMVMCGNLGRN